MPKKATRQTEKPVVNRALVDSVDELQRAPVLAFRNTKPRAPRRMRHEMVIERKLARLLEGRPLCATVIEQLIDDLLAEYDAAPWKWPGGDETHRWPKGGA